MLDVRVYDTEKNTWNININGKEHEIRIDVWRDIYVDDEKVGAVRELTEREWNGEKYVWRLFIPVDGVRVEHRYYEWENPNETKAHIFLDGIDLTTGEKEIIYKETKSPWWVVIFMFVFTVNAMFTWSGIWGLIFRFGGLALMRTITLISVKTEYSMRKRFLICLGILGAFALVGAFLFMNNWMAIIITHRRRY